MINELIIIGNNHHLQTSHLNRSDSLPFDYFRQNFAFVQITLLDQGFLEPAWVETLGSGKGEAFHVHIGEGGVNAFVTWAIWSIRWRASHTIASTLARASS